METKLQGIDCIRISADENIFIDIERSSYNIVSSTHYRFNYIEIRKKEGYVKVFTFKDKTWLEDFNFEWWKDAEIIYKSEK